MDYGRYTISELSRLTNTSRTLIHAWKSKGYLKPTQITGTRAKYSLQAFLEAEKLALKNGKTTKQNEHTSFMTDAFIDKLLKIGGIK